MGQPNFRAHRASTERPRRPPSEHRARHPRGHTASRRHELPRRPHRNRGLSLVFRKSSRFAATHGVQGAIYSALCAPFFVATIVVAVILTFSSAAYLSESIRPNPVLLGGLVSFFLTILIGGVVYPSIALGGALRASRGREWNIPILAFIARRIVGVAASAPARTAESGPKETECDPDSEKPVFGPGTPGLDLVPDDFPDRDRHPRQPLGLWHQLPRRERGGLPLRGKARRREPGQDPRRKVFDVSDWVTAFDAVATTSTLCRTRGHPVFASSRRT